MKKRKLLFLLLGILLLSGCEVKYNIELDNGKISEEIIIPYDSIYQESYEQEYYYDVVNNKKYSSSIEHIDGINKFVLKSKKIDIKAISDNDLYDFCYDSINVLLEDNIYYIGTSGNFKCMNYDYLDIDTFELNIKTYNKVIKSNADKNKLNTYTWVINRDNFNNKNITFVVSKNQYVWYYKYRGLFIGLIGVLAIVLIIFLIKTIFSKKSSKANEI